jgi:hypothetical protein
MSMSSTLSRRRSASSPDWAAEPPVERPARRKRSSQGFSRFLITFCVGIAATLAWQTYGDAAKGIVASQYPQLAWLAPQAAATPASNSVVPPTSSPDSQELKAISFSLTAMRQRIDQLAASQDQVTRDITTKLQVAKQEILDRIPTPSPQQTTPPARKPALPSAVAPVR